MENETKKIEDRCPKCHTEIKYEHFIDDDTECCRCLCCSEEFTLGYWRAFNLGREFALTKELESLRVEIGSYQKMREREVGSANRIILSYLKSEKYFEHDEFKSRFATQGIVKINELIAEGLVRVKEHNNTKYYIYSKYDDSIIWERKQW